MRISEHRPGEVYRGVLGQWNTSGLAPGPHTLRLALVLSSGDTIGVTKPVQLYDAPVAVDAPTRPAPQHIDIAPNPVPRGTRSVTITVPTSYVGPAMATVRDLFGRVVRAPCDVTQGTGGLRAELNVSGLVPGSYFVTLRSGVSAVSGKFVVSR